LCSYKRAYTHTLLNAVTSNERLSDIFNDTKHRAVSLRQLSFLLPHVQSTQLLGENVNLTQQSSYADCCYISTAVIYCHRSDRPIQTAFLRDCSTYLMTRLYDYTQAMSSSFKICFSKVCTTCSQICQLLSKNIAFSVQGTWSTTFRNLRFDLNPLVSQ